MELFRNEDSGYFLADHGPESTGLPMRIYTYPYLYIDDLPERLQVPSILVSNWIGYKTAIWNDDNFMLSLDEQPRLLDGRCKLTRDELHRVHAWIRLNRVVLIVNWEGSLSTPELFDDLKPLGGEHEH
jgi:hypothetical protein